MSGRGQMPLAMQGRKVVAQSLASVAAYYPGKKNHHKRVTTERPHPTVQNSPTRAWARPREGHGKGKLIRILFSVYFGGFRG